MIKRLDILEELEAVHIKSMRPGTADSDINVYAQPVEMTYGLLVLAIQEIKRLRGDVVVTMAGFREIKQGIKDGPSL